MCNIKKLGVKILVLNWGNVTCGNSSFHLLIYSLYRSGLIDLIHLWNKDVERFYEEQIMDQKKIYSQR